MSGANRTTLAASLASALALSCAGDALTPLDAPRFEISDGAHDGLAGFYFLPPLVQQPLYTGVFDGSLAPTVVITEGDDVLAELTAAVNLADELYQADWDTEPHDLDPALTYRLTVSVDGFELGFADLEVAENRKEIHHIRANETVPLLDGYTLPVKFRIEEGAVPAPTGFSEVLAGGGTGAGGGAGFTCALTADGVAYCWGENTFGQLGSTDSTFSSVPLPVAGGNQFTELSVGGIHNCGLAGGQTWCWGYNRYGQVGDATQVNRFTPVSVADTLGLAQVAAGGFTSCGIDADGAAFCWGWGYIGERGDGVATEVQMTPTTVLGGLAFSLISVGAYHTCGLTLTGAAYCWGDNREGELGSTAAADTCQGPCSLTPLAVEGGLSFVDIDPGGLWSATEHTCALTAAGDAYCWGANTYGQLGDGTQENRSAPTAVTGGLTFESITTLGEFTCGLTTGGTAYCWGQNALGQLGNGTTVDSSVPVGVSGGYEFASLVAGSEHACGVTTDGVAYCWGRNTEGQLGDGTRTNSSVPVRVLEP